VNPGEQHSVLSVRGEAQRTVAPDQVSIFCAIASVASSKSVAMAEAARALSGATGRLAAAGGVALTVDTARAPLTWSTQSIHTYPEHAHNHMTGEHAATGRHHASASLLVAVRDFALLPEVEVILTGHDAVELHSVQWLVDHDNPAWGSVRADAIQAALLKGRDYAAALGGSIISVDHVADAGLLGGDTPSFGARGAARAMSLASGEAESASLDPVPQVLFAVIEARLTATVAPLAPR
jgi:uncharacterized protein YggE